MAPDVDANRVAAAKKREARVEFMRAFALATTGRVFPAMSEVPVVAKRAREMWDAIEAEAAK